MWREKFKVDKYGEKGIIVKCVLNVLNLLSNGFKVLFIYFI